MGVVVLGSALLVAAMVVFKASSRGLPNGELLSAASIANVMVKEENACSFNGESCLETKCCAESGMTCYKKNEGWASCNATCNEKMMWNTSTNKFEEQAEKVWDCHKLSCSVNGENCMDSKCCLLPGMTCYKKNEHWASCNATCNEKMKWNTETNK